MILRSMKEIVEELKNIISRHMGDNPVYQKDVSIALRIPPATFNSKVARNSIPFQEILEWCAMTGIDPMKIFYEERWK